RVLDAVEEGLARPPVIRVAHQLDRFVGFELDKFERAGTDRVLAHVTWADMARVDRRKAGGEQGQKGRLRPLQLKGRLVNVVGGDLDKIAVPGLTRIDAQFLARLALQ